MGVWAFGADNGAAGLIIPELLDFLINGRDVGVPGFRLFEQRSNQRSHLGFGGRFQIELIKFGERVHSYYYTAITRYKPCIYWFLSVFLSPVLRVL